MKFLNSDWLFQNKKEFWGAVIGAAVSLYQGAQAAGDAEDAANAAATSREARLTWAQGEQDAYKEKYGENEQALIDSVDNFTMRDNLEKYQTEGTVNTAAAYDKSKEMQNREMQRYGINPASMRYQEKGSELGMDRAKTEVYNLNRARTQAEEERIQDEDKLFSRRIAVGEFGKKADPTSAAVERAYSGEAIGYTDEASNYADEASSSYGVAGEFASEAIDSYTPSDTEYDTDSWTPSDTGELGW